MEKDHINASIGPRSGPAVAKRTFEAVGDEPVAVLMINVNKVASLLGIGTRTVWRLVDRHELPAPIAIGGRRLWHWPTLESFISAKVAASVTGNKVGRR